MNEKIKIPKAAILYSFLACIQIGLLIYIGSTIWSQPLYIWDEAIYGNNALEMLMHGNLLEYTLNFEPNLYNTKPPLVLWLQSFTMYLFGPNVLALRLPTFIALIGLIIGIIRFAKRKFNLQIGIVTSIIILTTPALISPHVFLTGDLDGVLVLISTLLILLTFDYSHQNDISNNQIYLLATIFFLAFFTKSTAIFILIPSLVFIVLRHYSLRKILTLKAFWISVFFILGGIVTYYFIKETYQAGTIKRVFFSEYERFYKNIMPWHSNGPFYYFEKIFTELNPYYTCLTLALLPLYLFTEDTKYKQNVITLFGALVIYLIIISIPDTKLLWYTAPIFPVWALIISIICYEFIEKLKLNEIIKQLSILLILSYPIYNIVIHIKKTSAFFQPEEKEMAYLLNLDYSKRPRVLKIFSAYPKDSTVTTGHNHHNDVILFYQKALKPEGIEISLNYDKENFWLGDTVITAQTNQIDSLNKYFILEKIDSNSLANMYTIIDLKHQNSQLHKQ